MDREVLHGQVESFGHTNWHVRAIIHCLIDLGRVKVLECESLECILDSRAFRPRKDGRGYQAYSLTLDHIDPRHNGGGHRPENLRLLHHACNLAEERGRTDSPETLAKKRRAARRRRRNGGYPTGDAWQQRFGNREPGWNRATRPDDRRIGNRARTPVLKKRQVEAMRRAHRKGTKVEVIAQRYGVSRSTAYSAIRGTEAYSSV